jgi:hypothetical protein
VLIISFFNLHLYSLLGFRQAVPDRVSLIHRWECDRFLRWHSLKFVDTFIVQLYIVVIVSCILRCQTIQLYGGPSFQFSGISTLIQI